jgi:hypothetical protein
MPPLSCGLPAHGRKAPIRCEDPSQFPHSQYTVPPKSYSHVDNPHPRTTGAAARCATDGRGPVLQPEIHLFEPTGYAGVFQHTYRIAQLLRDSGVRVVFHTGH